MRFGQSFIFRTYICNCFLLFGFAVESAAKARDDSQLLSQVGLQLSASWRTTTLLSPMSVLSPFPTGYLLMSPAVVQTPGSICPLRAVALSLHSHAVSWTCSHLRNTQTGEKWRNLVNEMNRTWRKYFLLTSEACSRESVWIDRLSTTFYFTREERVASTSRGNVHVDATRVWGL